MADTDGCSRRDSVTKALIDLVREYPALWHLNHPEHKNKALTASAWKDVYNKLKEAYSAEILEYLSLPNIAEVRHKWLVLTRQFCNFKRRRQAVLASDPRHKGLTPFKWEKELDFLHERHDNPLPEDLKVLGRHNITKKPQKSQVSSVADVNLWIKKEQDTASDDEEGNGDPYTTGDDEQFLRTFDGMTAGGQPAPGGDLYLHQSSEERLIGSYIANLMLKLNQDNRRAVTRQIIGLLHRKLKEEEEAAKAENIEVSLNPEELLSASSQDLDEDTS